MDRRDVILGAGYDSRAHRMKADLKGVKVFEVDFPPTQQTKKARVMDLFGRFPDNVTYVPIDFTKQELGATLKKAGFKSDKKAFFIWEGVSYYLPEEAVGKTLRLVGDSAPGSSIVFDARQQSYIDWVNANIDSPLDRVDPRARKVLLRLQKYRSWGEPNISGLPDGKEKEYLAKHGLELKKLLRQDGPEAQTLYQTRQDGTIAFPIKPSDAVPAIYIIMIEAETPGNRSGRT